MKAFRVCVGDDHDHDGFHDKTSLWIDCVDLNSELFINRDEAISMLGLGLLAKSSPKEYFMKEMTTYKISKRHP